MSDIKKQLLKTLWRGYDPLSDLAPDAREDLQGWGSNHRYLGEAVESIRPKVIVEIGVWKGASTIHLASHLVRHEIQGVVIAVDTWLGAWDHWIDDTWFEHLRFSHGYPTLFHTFAKNVQVAGLSDFVVPLPLDSINAAKVLNRFGIKPDIVHLDGAHDYAAVRADLQAWWDVLTPGGMLIGDDYRAGNDWPEVKQAFDDFFGPLGLTPLENVADKCRVTKPTVVASTPAVATSSFRETAQAVVKWRENCRLELASLIDDHEIGLAQLVERYVNFPGPTWDGMRRPIMDDIVRRLREERGATFSEKEVFGPQFEITPQVLAQHFPELNGSFFTPAEPDTFVRLELLPPSPNPFFKAGLRPPFDRGMARPTRPAFAAYRSIGAALLVTPLGYMLFQSDSGIYWPAASTRCYAKSALDRHSVEVDRPVVVVQDTFEGSNFCHFLFDWVERIGHFVEGAPEDPKDCLFLLGGIPGDFHSRIIAALCDMYGLQPEQFVFPTGVAVWHSSKPIWFFSDVRLDFMHPANLGNEKSIRMLRQISGHQTAKPGAIRRLYITRNDTFLRQVTNERALWGMLRRYGFSMVRLGDLDIEQQISVFRGAEIIVAAHGMGLTHMAFHNGSPRILELHNPDLGSDSYGFMAAALGFPYHAVFGEPTDMANGHYAADVSAVENLLIGAGVDQNLPRDPPWDFGSGWWPGVQSRSPGLASEISPPEPHRAVMHHVRDSSAIQPDNNVGWRAVDNLLPGAAYTASCRIWIPTDFAGGSIELVSGELLRMDVRRADMTRRGEWQTLKVGGTASGRNANFVLRVSADAEQWLYSSCWEVQAGVIPGPE